MDWIALTDRMPNPDEHDRKCCKEYYQYRNGLCWSCWTAKLDRKAEERHDRRVIECQERKEK